MLGDGGEYIGRRASQATSYDATGRYEIGRF